MKKIITLIVSIIFVNTLFSQQTVDEELPATCYQKYASVFEKRGAFPVENGTHDDVIITFRKGSSADCFLGKVTVKEGILDINEIYMKFEDNTYEKVEKKYKYAEEKINIVNGISKTIVCYDDELINIMFTKKIKPKKKNYARAKEPEFDL
jgi:hypothetical protein